MRSALPTVGKPSSKNSASASVGVISQQHELHVWSKCTHSYVQELLGVAYVRNQFAMISPWLEHGSLPEYMKRNPMIDRCKMCTQIAEGLAYLHGRDIIHGDIKGPNILVANDHTPRLTDFGNATLREYSLRFATSNTKNPISWRWAPRKKAPELYKEGKESKEADIYTLGMDQLGSSYDLAVIYLAVSSSI
ncbi:kinase-like protein [Ceratobasidium sp. AG-I]|nr:kinase-like protein [Ceratobasidium sp. AG-I]